MVTFTRPSSFAQEKEQKMDVVFPIPHVELTKDEKAKNVLVMAAGNVILKDWHLKIQEAAQKATGTRYSRAKFRGELFRQAKPSRPLDMYGKTIPADDINTILTVRKIEMPMLMAHAKLMDTLSRKALHMNRNCGLDLEDFFNESLVAAMNAFYCYTKTDIIFSTYLVHAVKRRLFNYALEQKGQSFEVHSLLKKLELERRNHNGPITSDELFKKLKLKPNQIAQISAFLNPIIHESEIPANHDDDFDFTTLARGAAKVAEVGLEFDEKAVIQEAISDSQLTEWESAVLDAFLAASDTHGWKTEVAENTINPDTGKTYSRAAPAVAMERITDKIREQLESRKVA